MDEYPVIDYLSAEAEQQLGNDSDQAAPKHLSCDQLDQNAALVAGPPIKAVACHPRFQEYAVLWNNFVVRTWSTFCRLRIV